MMERRDIAGVRLGGLESELLELLRAAGQPLGPARPIPPVSQTATRPTAG
jgi:hypothetical protein